MAYKTWCDYGFGICVSSLKIDSIPRIEKVIQQTKKFRKEVNEIFEELEISEPTLQDYEELDQDYYNGIAYILQRVIKEKEHLELSVCDDFDGERYLMYMPDYPWFTPLKCCFISEKKVERIIKKYTLMLTDDDIKVDYIEVENGG